MIFIFKFNFFQNFCFSIFDIFARVERQRFNKVQLIISVTLMEDRMTSSRHGLDELGYTRTTMIVTMRCKNVSLSYSLKTNLSSNCSLKLKNMKLELLVIVYHNDTVNLGPVLAHTARHATEAHFILHIKN